MNYYFYSEPIDMRCGIDRLLAHVPNAQPGDAYIFCNKSRSRLKVLRIDQFGVWLSLRRLHQGHFFQLKLQQQPIQLSEHEWQWLNCGLNWTKLRQNIRLRLDV